MGRVLCLGGIPQDGSGQAIGGIEMVVGQADEGLGALGCLLDPDGSAFRHVDDLGRSPHDDMTIQEDKTFMPVSAGPIRRTADLGDPRSIATAPRTSGSLGVLPNQAV